MSITPSNKRVLTLSQTPKLHNTPQLSEYHSSPKLLQLMEKKLMKQFENLTLMLRETEERILKQLDSKVSELKFELHSVNERLNEVESVVSEVKVLKDEVSELQCKLGQYENSLVSCELRINSVPYCENENLNVLFHTLCENLKICTPEIQQIYRIKARNNTAAPTILVKCSKPYERNFVLKTIAAHRRKNKGNLQLNMLGLNSNQPIYVNENLSRTNFKLFQEARKFKKNNLLFSVFTLRGIVHVKRKESEEPVHIHSADQLHSFFRNGTAADGAMQ